MQDFVTVILSFADSITITGSRKPVIELGCCCRNCFNFFIIFSQGHAAPILYAAWAEAGLFPVDELKNLRKLDSDLEGHPTPRLNFIDVGTGSLGQGLAVAAGMAYIGKFFDQASYR